MGFPAMKRCECAGKAFEEVAALVAREGLVDLDRICRRSGCAQLCTACRPDLERFLKLRAMADFAGANTR
jgi:NAD(P)H-nitrite reductase large subunit